MGHKMLNVPYDSALVAVKDSAALNDAMNCGAPYVAPSPLTSEADVIPSRELAPEIQNSRRGRGVVAYAALRQLGRSGVTDLVDRLCDHATLLANLLSGTGVAKLLNKVVFNQVLVT